MPRREPTPYTPSPDEWAALGARLFGLEEHEPVPRTPALSDLSHAKPNTEKTNAKN